MALTISARYHGTMSWHDVSTHARGYHGPTDTLWVHDIMLDIYGWTISTRYHAWHLWVNDIVLISYGWTLAVRYQHDIVWVNEAPAISRLISMGEQRARDISMISYGWTISWDFLDIMGYMISRVFFDILQHDITGISLTRQVYTHQGDDIHIHRIVLWVDGGVGWNITTDVKEPNHYGYLAPPYKSHNQKGRVPLTNEITGYGAP